MAINIEKADAAFNFQLKNFSNKISNYSTVLGLTPAEVTAIKADAAAFDYILNNQLGIQTFAQNYTAFKIQLRNGTGLTLGALPLQPVFPAAPPMPVVNIESRFRALLQRIVHNAAYTKAMGQDLGIEASQIVFYPAGGKPAFFIEMSSGGHPNLRWTKGKYQGVEIWKDSGSGFLKLDRDMYPDYIDKSSLPAAGTTAVWKYKMIYLFNDEIIGNWSDPVSVTVHGEV